WELLIMRSLFACVVYMTLPSQGQIYDTQTVPNGIANFVDLTFLANEGVYPALKIALSIALVIYASGFMLPLVLPFILVSQVMVRTLFNSQGWVHHGVQMVSLALLAQTIVVLTFAIYPLVKGKPFPFTEGRTIGSYFLFYTQMAIVSIYVVSVVSKVDRSDGQWFAKSHYIGLHVVKAERDRYYGKLQAPEPGDVPAARLMLAHPNLTRLFLGAGVLLEFFAFAALYGRGAAALIALALIGFHRSIAALMSIYFHFNEMLLVIFLINVPFWLVWLAKKVSNQRPETATGAVPASS
ncbi:MAG: hypothetical protein ACR2RV_26295, partial [Verrucomicrobiales bacterium]